MHENHWQFSKTQEQIITKPPTMVSGGKLITNSLQSMLYY